METAPPFAFGDVLRRYRLDAGLTQEQLAERAGVSARSIGDMERGGPHLPRLSTMRQVAAALQLPPADRAMFFAAARQATHQPRLRPAAGDVPTNLPAPTTLLIGRERDEAAVTHLLQKGQRLLTLTGPGGVGKTRLALQVAEHLRPQFPDGVLFIPLAALRDAGLVAPTIAQAVGLRDAGGLPVGERMHAYLRSKEVLLVLDNFEQVLEAAPVVAELLAASRGLRVLVTSRAALRLQEEQQYLVPPLAVPERAPYPDVATLAQYAAVALFIQRVRLVNPSFHLTPANMAAVAQVCTRLDGLPLAIELAAARVKLLTPQTLLMRLAGDGSSADRVSQHALTAPGPALDLLTGGPRDLPPRLQTMRSAIAWSYDLLEERAQVLLRRLCVFVGGCTLEAVEAVCRLPADPDTDVLVEVTALVDNSLLHPLEGAGGMTRFTMLETIHDFGRERLGASGEADTLRQRHAAHYLAVAQVAERALTGPDQAVWLARLADDVDNLRAALRWAVESSEVETGLGLAGALWRFWQVRGALSEGLSWLEQVLALPTSDGTGVRVDVLVARANALYGAAVLATEQGDYGRAVSWTEDCLRVRRQRGDTAGIAASLNVLASVARYQADYERATALYDESLALRRELGDTWGMSVALNNLGNVLLDQGAYARAAAVYEECLAIKRALGDKRGLASVLNNLGETARYQGDYQRAVALHEESLALRQDLDDSWGLALSLNNLASVARDQGDDGRAATLSALSLALRRDLGDTWSMAFSLSNLGAVATDQGKYGRATMLHQESLALRRILGDQRGIALSLLDLAHLARAQGDERHARALYAQSLRACWQVGDKRSSAAGLEGLAEVCGAQGQPAHAVRLCAAAAALREAIEAPLPPADCARYKRVLSASRQAVGDEAFAAAWAAGRRVRPEQVLAEVCAQDAAAPD